ncbi:hypothetical protein, partial [Nocardia cerradoensis]|uniref:hypothetical protein n=1 Tax=Nocardia cerradoensis TaxID=85688 RepID=UPI00118092DF
MALEIGDEGAGLGVEFAQLVFVRHTFEFLDEPADFALLPVQVGGSRDQATAVIDIGEGFVEPGQPCDQIIGRSRS